MELIDSMLKRVGGSSGPAGAEGRTSKMESTSLIQGSSCFLASPMNVAECQKYLCKILRAIYNGETFTAKDTETIFFAIIQALNNKDLLLHRLIFLVLRYLDIAPDIAIMVTHSLSKDISSDMLMNRARAVRLLPHVLMTDHVLMQERFIKQIIISKAPLQSTSGLACALSLCFKGASEVVKKWVPEIYNASNGSLSAQYMALLTLYYLRRGDGSLLRKMADQRKDLAGLGVLGSHVMIHVCDEAHRLTGSESAEKFIISKLHSASPITQLDAARAILANEKSSSESITAAVNKLNTLLSAPTNITVYAALRTISMYASKHKEEFSKCNTALERMLSQGDGTMSALAAMSLLQTGFESTIDRVLPSIASFAVKLSGQQQALMIKACVDVAKRHPTKLETILTFIWKTFRGVDDLEVQTILVNGFFEFAETLPQSREVVFKHLCEYLEDSTFESLSIMIVHFIGKIGMEQDNRSELIRCLCNRLSLEGSEVRATTLDALFNFHKDPQLGSSVCKIIKNHLNDGDDEVRDRATFYTQIIEENLEEILEVDTSAIESIQNEDVEAAKVEVAAPVKAKAKPFGKEGLENKSIRIKATDEDADIVVSYVTKLYSDSIVFDFKIKNTLPEEICNVSVKMEDTNDEMKPSNVIPIETLEPNKDDHCYVVFDRPAEDLAFTSFASFVVFFTVDDPDSEETFELDVGVDLKIRTYMKETALNNFEQVFAEVPYSHVESARIGKMKTIDDVVRFLVEASGMSVITKNEVTDSKKRKLTVVKMAGLLFGKELGLVMVEIAPQRLGAFPVRVTAKSEMEEMPEAIVRSLLE